MTVSKATDLVAKTGQPHTAEFHELVGAELPRLFAFASLACGYRPEALRVLAAILRAASRDSDVPDLFPRLVAKLVEVLGRRADQHFVVLDNQLRADASRPLDLDAPPICGDPARVLALLAELKQNCLIAALGCLPPGMRLAFILVDMLGHTQPKAAALLRATESALLVKLTRARRRLADYLGPRCGHLAPGNFCSCAGRLGVALATGFVTLPPVPPRPARDAAPARDVLALYRSLPGAALVEEERRALLAALAAGAGE